MSGLEVLGAVAASVQLAGNCCTIGKRLLQQRSESVVADEIHERCKTLLSEINEHMTKLSPTGREAAQELAACLQRIKHKIYLHKQGNGFVKMFQVVTGKTFVYREQMMMALYRYQVSAVLDGNEMMGQLLAGQTTISDQLNEIAMPLMEALAKLTSNNDSLRTIDSTSRREEQPTTSDFEREILKALTDAIKEEVGALRKDLASRPLLTESTHLDRSELTADYGTMASYLQSIWESGGFTTDQDIWECFYDIVTVYINEDLPTSFRATTFPSENENNETDIWEHLSCYRREPCFQGMRRCRWKFRTPLKSKSTKRVNNEMDLERLHFVLTFLVSSEVPHGALPFLVPKGCIEFSDSANPNLANVCYRVGNGREISAIERVNRLLFFSDKFREDFSSRNVQIRWSDYDDTSTPFWEYISMIPDPSCIWDVHHNLARHPIDITSGYLGILQLTKPRNAKNGLVSLEILYRIARYQNKRLNESWPWASIKYIDDDGEREQDDDDLKADDEHFDDDGDHAYDESDVVEADETTFTKFKYTLSRNGES